MRFASERGEASYYTCYKMDNCVSDTYRIIDIISLICSKISHVFTSKNHIFFVYLKWLR